MATKHISTELRDHSPAFHVEEEAWLVDKMFLPEARCATQHSTGLPLVGEASTWVVPVRLFVKLGLSCICSSVKSK